IWTDVALLDSNGQLDWAGIINDKSRHAVSFCPTACHSDKPAPPPPCILQIIGESNACSFRKSLTDLERLTKSPDSRSLGELSKLCFSKLNGFSPYISTFSTEFVPLLYTREAILKRLASEANVLLPDTKQSKEYAKAAQECMPAIKTK